MRSTSRREFVKSSVGAACLAGFGGLAGKLSVRTLDSGRSAATSARAGASLPIKKGLVFDMLPSSMSYADRFKLARDAGFEVVQANTTPDEHEAEELKNAAEAAGVRIDSVMNMDHWKYPLSSGDAAVVAKSMQGMRTSLRNAKLWGADAVLLVPAVVNPQTTYLEA